MRKLTYQNRRWWNQVPPSMDDKKTKSPPIRTTAEYERDRGLGVVTPVGFKRKPIISDRRTD